MLVLTGQRCATTWTLGPHDKSKFPFALASSGSVVRASLATAVSRSRRS